MHFFVSTLLNTQMFYANKCWKNKPGVSLVRLRALRLSEPGNESESQVTTGRPREIQMYGCDVLPDAKSLVMLITTGIM